MDYNSSIFVNPLSRYAYLFLTLFAISRQSWGLIIPGFLWAIVILVSDLILFYYGLYISKGRIKVSFKVILLFVMFSIMTFYNQENSTIIQIVSFLIIFTNTFAMYAMCSNEKNDTWIEFIQKILLFFSILYAIFTYMSYIISGFYNAYLKGLFLNYGLIESLASPSAGFTTTSTNNGLYISIGIIMLGSHLFFTGKYGIKPLKTILWIVLLLALFMTGKRGMVIGVTIAFLISYFVYTTNKKKGRIFKLIVVILIILSSVYIVSLVFPAALYFIDKSKNLLEGGDVTNGRLVLWLDAFRIFRASPIKGYGWRWFRAHNSIAHTMDVHNVYLQLISELGIVGAIPFYLFFVFSYVRAVKIAKLIRLKFSKDRSVCEKVYFALVLQSFLLFYFIGSTAFYMPECIFLYIFSCSIFEYYSNRTRILLEV